MKSVFDNIENDLLDLKSNPSSAFKSNEDSIQYNSGNGIQDLYDVIHNLFKELSLIIEEDDKHTEVKFKFINSYPDEIYNDYNNIVTFEVLRRVPFIADSKAINNGGTKYIKPRFIKDKYNSITGNVEELYSAIFSNVISITCFSNKARTLNNMASLIESVFYKYSSYIRQYVDQWYYIGMGQIQFINKYDQQERLFARELQFNVVTSELFVTEEEHIKSIDIKKQTN